MHTVVIGVRHRTAPIDIREKLAFDTTEIADALCEMLMLPGITEGAILTTCNRSEVYATVTDTEVGIRSLKTFLKEYKGFDYNHYMPYTFCLLHEDAVMHLFRVAAGLDSLVLGEGQIMAQIKEALKIAIKTRSSGEMIDKLFKTALSAGKAVRAETGIASRDVSVSRAAFECAMTHHPDFVQHRIAVIGAGKMAEIMMGSIKNAMLDAKQPLSSVSLVNRTLTHSQVLAEKYGFTPQPWETIEDVIQACDTLFVATASPRFILSPAMFQGAENPKVIIDISVPRNVDPTIGEQPGITLYNTDNLSGYSGYTGETRMRLIQQAHQIIEREYRLYYQWSVSRSAAPVITQLRARLEDIRRSEVADIEALCPHVQKSCSIIDDLSRTLVNKILHDPTVCLRSTPELDDIYTQAVSLGRLFNISLDTPISTLDS
jgi:glutamyl-tRNA reductase